MQLSSGEKLLAEAQASHIKKLLVFPQPNPGKMYVTDKRVVFESSHIDQSASFTHDLAEITSFSAGAASTITLHLKGGEAHKITGMFNKKLIAALTEAGVQKD